MNESEVTITRGENILKLGDFCGDLLRAFLRAGHKPEGIAELWRRGVTAECEECHMRVYGDELFALALPPDPEQTSAKLDRMRQGYCARKDCQGWTYTLRFSALPQVDWALMLSDTAAIHAELSGDEVRKRRQWKIRMHPALRWPAIAAGGILLVLFAREWRLSGHLPLGRQPEKFHVDVGPE